MSATGKPRFGSLRERTAHLVQPPVRLGAARSDLQERKRERGPHARCEHEAGEEGSAEENQGHVGYAPWRQGRDKGRGAVKEGLPEGGRAP